MASGILHPLYHPGKEVQLPVFEHYNTCDEDAKNAVILLSGLGDGFMSSACRSYVPKLAKKLSSTRWLVLEPLVGSCFNEWANRSGIADDCEEVMHLLRWLRDDRLGKRGIPLGNICLIGHSTGCQIITHLLSTFKHHESHDRELLCHVKFAVLQAPVSDRGAFLVDSTLPHLDAFVEHASECVRANDELALLDTGIQGYPLIQARRVLSLFKPGGKEDMFSAELSDAELHTKLKDLGSVQVLLIFSMNDEFVRTGVYPLLCERLVKAAGPGAEGVQLEGADHQLNGPPQAVDKFVTKVAELLSV